MNKTDMSQEKDWSQMAENFDQLQQYIVCSKTTEMIIEKLESLENTGQTLEFGCGNGTFTMPLVKNAEKITAVDCSKDMVKAAIKRLKYFDKIQVEEGNCYQTNYQKESFDTILMANLIHVVESPEKALLEARRLLRKNGRLILVSFTKDGMQEKDLEGMIRRYLEIFGTPPKHGTPFSLASLKDFVEKYQFKIEGAELIGFQSKAIYLVCKIN